MKMYQLAEEYRNLMIAVEDQETGITEEQKSILDAIGDLSDQKVESIAMLIREIEAESEVINTESKRLAGKARSLDNRAAWLKNYAMDCMGQMSKDGVQGQILKIKIQNNPPSCEILDEEVVPTSYVTEVVTKKIDKRAILEDYKASGEIPAGCAINVGKSLRIR